MRPSRGKLKVIALIAVLATAFLAFLLIGGDQRTPFRVGMSEHEWLDRSGSITRSARNRRFPWHIDVMVGCSQWKNVISTRYYFREGHYFFTRVVAYEFTNGVLARIEAPYRKWRFDL